MTANKVLVAGASGLVGHAAVEWFAQRPDWEVVGVSRRVPADITGATLLSVDLEDEQRCDEVFSQLSDVTHLVYAALHEIPGLMPGWTDDATIERNGRMLRNLFEPLSRVAANLQHVSLLHGTKAYGLHHPAVGLANVRIPLREREPRVPHPNFYFVQEDYLLEKQRHSSWAMTVFRPTVIYGDAVGNNMNPIPAIGAYAALLRERGEPLYFPKAQSVPAIREAVDAELVAEAIGWAATAEKARNRTFNLTNGDVFAWEFVWPAIAETLGMEAAPPRPFSFVEDLPAQSARWTALVGKYGLAAPEDLVEFVGYNSLVYADAVLSTIERPGPPILNSTIAAREAGFHGCIDTEDMFRKCFRRLVDKRFLPPAQ